MFVFWQKFNNTSAQYSILIHFDSSSLVKYDTTKLYLEAISTLVPEEARSYTLKFIARNDNLYAFLDTLHRKPLLLNVLFTFLPNNTTQVQSVWSKKLHNDYVTFRKRNYLVHLYCDCPTLLTIQLWFPAALYYTYPPLQWVYSYFSEHYCRLRSYNLIQSWTNLVLIHNSYKCEYL